ncbi:hypothetical protein L3X38_018564 [Prunus dulcis]|uniref:Uncharacterized protein n=1 Tax=Prunus dulcis TaxID=3755 RepID=A0AAD4ZA77_PRUDU|nr:hypothetical protein L3X38_018564 [Prunus dulcis]
MTGASSSSNPSQVQPPADVVSPKTGEEAAGVIRISPPSISLLRPPIPTSDGRLCRNFGRKSRSLLSGPGIRVMSAISTGFASGFGKFGAGPSNPGFLSQGVLV